MNEPTAPLFATEQRLAITGQRHPAFPPEPAMLVRLTNELCDKRLLARTADASDRRKVVLTFTHAGTAMIGGLLPELGALMDRQAAGWQPREMLQLERLLKKFLKRPGQG